MTVGVCFVPAGAVESVTILSFEEARGQPVKEQAFLSQFEGGEPGRRYIVGQDIDAVSGATWSSKAVSEAVRKAKFAFDTFVGPKLGRE